MRLGCLAQTKATESALTNGMTMKGILVGSGSGIQQNVMRHQGNGLVISFSLFLFLLFRDFDHFYLSFFPQSSLLSLRFCYNYAITASGAAQGAGEVAAGWQASGARASGCTACLSAREACICILPGCYWGICETLVSLFPCCYHNSSRKACAPGI
jgi:hypothetical protein